MEMIGQQANRINVEWESTPHIDPGLMEQFPSNIRNQQGLVVEGYNGEEICTTCYS